MSRVALLFVLLAPSAAAADLPPGAVVRLGDERFRAGDGVERLALAPDGKRYATAQSAGDDVLALTVWDSATGRPLSEQRMNRELFRGLVWGPGGAFAVAARTEPAPKGQRGKIIPDDFRVWDFTDPDAAPPLLPPQGLVERTSGSIFDAPPKTHATYTHFLFSADGRRVAVERESADEKCAVHVFDLKPAATAAKLTRVGAIDLGAEGTDAVRLSANGETLVTFRRLADPDRTPGAEFVATVWDVKRGTPSQPFLVRTGEQFTGASVVPRVGRSSRSGNQLLLTPDGRSVIVAMEEEKMWGFDEVPLVLPLKDPQPKKRRIVTRWPNEPGADRRSSSDYGGSAFSASGEVLVIAANRKTFVIDVTGGKELARFEGHAWTPNAVAVSADGGRIATADLFGSVRIWDAKTLRPLSAAPGHRAPVEHAELSPDGKRLLTWAPDETVRIWDVATGAELRAFAGVPGSRGIYSRRGDRPTFTPDGTAVLFSTKDRLVSRDLVTGLEIPLPGDLAKSKPRYAVFAPDGKAVLTWADTSPPIEVFDWPGGTKRFELAPDGSVQPAWFTLDSKAVFTGTAPARWDARTGKELPPAWKDKHSDDLYTLLALRPNPPLMHAPREAAATVLDSGSGAAVSRFRFGQRPSDGTSYYAWCAAVSPVGGQIAGTHGRISTEVLLFEAATGQVRRTLDGHRGDVRVLGFTPDGSRLLTAGGDHTVLVWDMRLQNVPLPDALKKETDAAKLWETLATGTAKDAYLAMARLAREPDVAITLAKRKLKPAAKGERETDASRVTDARAIELLEALDAEGARALLKELSGGHADAFRTREAKRALERTRKE